MIPRQLLREPYQVYGDSPTIKSYTDWRLYDEYYEKLADGKLGAGYGRILVEDSGRISIGEGMPYGIIGPVTKPLKIHYSLNPRTRRLMIKDAGVNVKLFIPEEEYVVPQHLVVEASGSSSLKIDVIGGGSRSLRSLVVEINVDDSSSLDLLINVWDTNNAPSYMVFGLRGGRDSRIRTIYYIRPGLMTHLELRGFMDGFGARHIVRGITIAGGRERLDNIVDLVNRASRTYSKLVYTAVLADGSVVAQRGTGRIGSTAYGSGVEYYSEGLMLGGETVFMGQPRLEIDNGDVMVARHAAHNTHILDNQIFYLQSRGLDEESAKFMIVKGFLLKEINDPLKRAYYESMVNMELLKIMRR